MNEYNLVAGIGQIVDFSDPENPAIKLVEWPSQKIEIWVYIDKDGAPGVHLGKPTPEQFRNTIYIDLNGDTFTAGQVFERERCALLAELYSAHRELAEQIRARGVKRK